MHSLPSSLTSPNIPETPSHGACDGVCRGMQVPAPVLPAGRKGKLPQSFPGLCESRGGGLLCTFQQRASREPLRACCWGFTSVLPELCNLLYSTCHIFVHRYILNSWDFLLRYSVFYRTIFIILERPYLSFLFKKPGSVIRVTDTLGSAISGGSLRRPPGCCLLKAKPRSSASAPELCSPQPPVMGQQPVPPLLTRVDSGFLCPPPAPNHSRPPHVLQRPFLIPRLKPAAAAGPATVPTSDGTVPLLSTNGRGPREVQGKGALAGTAPETPSGSCRQSLERGSPLLQVHTQPSLFCHPSPHTRVSLTPRNTAEHRTVRCPGGHRMSPGDPSTLTGRAAPSGSRAEQGRSVCLQSLLPCPGSSAKRCGHNWKVTRRGRSSPCLQPRSRARLSGPPVLGEVTLSAGPQGGRACHHHPPPRSLFLAVSGERQRPRGASPCDLGCEARTAQSTCLHRALPPPHQHIAVLREPRPGGVPAPGQRDGHLRPKVLSGIRIGPWR